MIKMNLVLKGEGGGIQEGIWYSSAVKAAAMYSLYRVRILFTRNDYISGSDNCLSYSIALEK